MTDKKIADLLSLDYQVGDLVRLVGDRELRSGLGLVKEVKRKLDDVVDVFSLSHLLHDQDEDTIVFPSKPQLLILWTGGENSIVKMLWMYPSEVAIYKKNKK